MSSRELDAVPSPGEQPPLTRREARERAEAQARAAQKPGIPRPSLPRPATKRPTTNRPSNRAEATKSQGSSAPSKLLSLGAMLFAAALLVGTTVPANAFLSDASAVGAASVVEKKPGQSLEVSDDALMAAASRDTFDVISYADQLRLKYGNVSYSFTATTGAIRWPFPYGVPITDGFGDRPAGTSGSAHHNGVDFVPGSGTPIYAVADGVVQLHAEDQGGYGNHVILSHDVNGLSFDSVYAHMQYGSSPLVTGEPIKAGDFIGLVGDTGDSYGAHLHFEIRINKVPVDPFAWLTSNATN